MSLEKSIAPQNSIIFISDPTQRVEVPADVGSTLVAVTSSCVSVGTLAEVDGETTVRLADSFADPEGEIVFDGSVETPGRRIAVSDVLGNSILEMDVPSSLSRVTIWANDPMEPDLILVRAS